MQVYYIEKKSHKFEIFVSKGNDCELQDKYSDTKKYKIDNDKYKCYQRHAFHSAK